MPPFPKPAFDFAYDLNAEINALRQYEATKPGRDIPAKSANHLLLATWNVANLGVQQRHDQDYQLIAELVSWFDLIAMQEVNDNLTGLRGIHQRLPASYRLLFSETGGNKERLAFIYDSSKVTPLEKFGKLTIPPSDLRNIKLPGIEQKFEGFDRNPYIGSFQVGAFKFVLINVHLFFGSDAPVAMNRRKLETFAVARWADNRHKNPNAYLPDIIALGDFNLPQADPTDPIFQILTSRGLHLPQHTSQIGSSIVNDNYYDQIGFFPGATRSDFTGKMNVFDFDGALFQALWNDPTHAGNDHADFFAYMRYYLSDHRILWAEFQI